MTHNTRAAARSRLDPTSSDAESLDRILLAACAVIWLAALGSAVAATVALVGLGSGHSAESSSSSGTPWLLYGVIGVSALIIVGAIPLLVRARRAALDDPRAGHGAGARPARDGRKLLRGHPIRGRRQLRSSQPAAAPTRARSAYPAFSGVSSFDASLPPAVDRIWLRCAVVIAIRDGVGAAGDRNRHLPDGRRPRHNLLGRICRRGPRHAWRCPPFPGFICASCTKSSTLADRGAVSVAVRRTVTVRRAMAVGAVAVRRTVVVLVLAQCSERLAFSRHAPLR